LSKLKISSLEKRSHGMHLNTEGKEYVAKELVSFIDAKLNKEELG
jgi:hypothetical protein